MPPDSPRIAGQFKAVIFDLDGTLLDTLADIAAAMNQVLVDHGHAPHPVHVYRQFIGDGLEKLIERALPSQIVTSRNVAAYLKAYRAAYAQNWHATTRPYPGIATLLTRLTQQGIRLAILSNKAHEFTWRMAATLLAAWKFQPVLGASAQFPKKPDPTALRHILADLNLAPDACLLAGDSGVDMQTAAAGNVFSVGVTWGFRPESELRENGCRFIARHPIDILSLFKI